MKCGEIELGKGGSGSDMVACECVGDSELNLFQVRRLRCLLSSKDTILRLFGRAVIKEGEKWRLHPLIHTVLGLDLAQDIGSIESGAEAPRLSWSSEYLRPEIW